MASARSLTRLGISLSSALVGVSSPFSSSSSSSSSSTLPPSASAISTPVAAAIPSPAAPSVSLAPSIASPTVVMEKRSLLYDLGGVLLLAIVTLLSTYWINKSLDPFSKRSQTSKQNKQQFFTKYSKTKAKKPKERTLPEFDEYESMLLPCITFPEDITVSFKDIGGLAETKAAIYESIILPLERPELFCGRKGKNAQRKLLTPPRGILLYGPPGTGKTMMAKAIAKDSGATFINVHFSALLDKYVGESQKFTHAIFTLAHKLAPSIIFIDEIDAFLRKRSSDDHCVTAQLTAQFLSLWDGLTTSEYSRVIVLGATNRPNDLDPAILRRLPRQFCFELPDFQTRKSILSLLLGNEYLSPDLDVATIAEWTQGYSGSDLKEMCKAAVLIPIREFVEADKKRRLAGLPVPSIPSRPNNASRADEKEEKERDSDEEDDEIPLALRDGVHFPRLLHHSDFQDAMEAVKKTGECAMEYHRTIVANTLDEIDKLVSRQDRKVSSPSRSSTPSSASSARKS